MANRASAFRTPIDGRWLTDGFECNVLGDFVDSSRPWDREPVPLPRRVTAVLWSIAGMNVLVGCWAGAVLIQFWPCSGVMCSLTTLGGRPGLLLALTSICVLTTMGMALPTGGLVRANGWQLAVLVLTAVVGIGCLLGPLVVLTVVAIAITVAWISVLFLVERL